MPSKPEFAVILAAAGQSRRFADPFQKKVFRLLHSKPLWMHSADTFARRDDVGQVVLVISADDKELFNEKYAASAALLGVEVVVGGSQRADSVLCGLAALRDDLPFVAVHDAARPCVSDASIERVFAAARDSGGAILATRVSSTLKRGGEDDTISATVSREGLWQAQTPQVFRTALLREAYRTHPNPSAATDEASIVEAAGGKVKLVESSPLNIKITTQADWKFAELAVRANHGRGRGYMT